MECGLEIILSVYQPVQYICDHTKHLNPLLYNFIQNYLLPQRHETIGSFKLSPSLLQSLVILFCPIDLLILLCNSICICPFLL